MLVFPQISTGASSLYPLTKTSRQRSVVNALGDGSTDVYSDPEARSLGWEMHAKGLTAVEWGAIETLFQATSGMWQTFTFLDPAGNLLAESETFGGSAWMNGALIDLTPGVADPFGTTRATMVTNAGARDGVCRADVGGAGEFSILLECLGADYEWDQRHAVDFNNWCEFDEDVRVRDTMDSNFSGCESRPDRKLGYVRGASGGGRLHPDVRHAMRSAVGTIRLQTDRHPRAACIRMPDSARTRSR